jgi:hypothetical protein
MTTPPPIPHAAPKRTNGCLIAALVVIGIGVLGIGGCVLFVGKVAHGIARENKAQIARADAEPLSDIQWQEIDEIYHPASKATDLQKKELWKNYKGKKVRWTGTVAWVGESLGTLELQVTLKPDSLGSDLLVKLNDTSKPKALKLNVGDQVTFEGILENWKQFSQATLNHGNIVDQED